MKSRINEKELSIKIIPLPNSDDEETLLYWLIYSLNLVSERDRDSSKIKIFLSIMDNKGISSEDISKLTGLSRATVIFHAKRMIKLGLIEYRSRKFYPKADNFADLISMIEEEFNNNIKNIKSIAKTLDRLRSKENQNEVSHS